MTINRRTLLKGTLASSAAVAAAGAGLLTPRTLLAAWPEAAFDADNMDAAMTGLDAQGAAVSGDITIKAPDIAENGAVVPVSVTTSIAGATSISIFVANNPLPLAAEFNLGPGVEGFVSTRLKMRKTSDVVAVVKTDSGLYSATKSVKVTIGGCGG